MAKQNKDFFQQRYSDLNKFPEPVSSLPKGKRLRADFFKCMAERMISEWVNDKCVYPYSTYSSRTISTLKAYAMGRQDSSKIKSFLLQKNSGDKANGKYMTRMNVSWECYDKLSQLLDIVKDKNLSQEYMPNFFAVDESSINTIKADREALKFYLDQSTKKFLADGFYRPQFEPTPEQLGLLNEQDVDDYFNSGSFSTQWQIAAQACVRATYRASNYMEQQDLCFDNHIINPEGLSGMRVDVDGISGIPTIQTLDIERCIIPYFSGRVSTGKITRAGVIKTMTLADVYKANPTLTPDELKYIAREYKSLNPGMEDILYNSGFDDYFDNQYLSTRADNYSDNPIMSARVYVLDFQFLGEDIDTFLKNENTGLFKEIDYDYNINRKSEKKGDEKVQKKVIRKYEAKWLIGTDYFITMDECKEVDYHGEEGNMTPQLDFFFSRHGNKSLIERCVAIVDDIWMRLIKERNIWATIPAAPAMVISKALLENVFLSGKKAASPEEIMSMFIEKGIFVYEDRDAHGKPKIQAGTGQKPFEIANIGPLLSFMSAATSDMMNKVNELRDVLGLTGGVDGVKSPYQGLGETELAFQSANSSLRPTFMAYNYLFKDVMIAVIKKWQGIAKKQKGKKKLPYSVIGEQNMKMIELSNNFINAEFQVGVSISPSSQEKQSMLMDLKELQKAGIQGGTGIDYSHYLYLYEKVMAGQIKEAMFHLSKILSRLRKDQQDFELRKIRENVLAQQESSDKNLENNMKLKEMEANKKISQTIIENLLKTVSDLQLKSVERGGEQGGINVAKADSLATENATAASQIIQKEMQPSQPQLSEEEMAMAQQMAGEQMPL